MELDQFYPQLVRKIPLEDMGGLILRKGENGEYSLRRDLICEPKMDGHDDRAESNPFADNRYVIHRTRRGKQPVYARPELDKAIVTAIPEHRVIVHGELVAFAPGQQIPDLKHALDAAALIKEAQSLGLESDIAIPDIKQYRGQLNRKRANVALFIHDLLMVDGRSLINEPHRVRRKLAKEVFRGSPDNRVQLMPQIRLKDLERFLPLYHDLGGEGVVIKNKDAPYRSIAPGTRHVTQRSNNAVAIKFIDYPKGGHSLDG